MSRIKRLVNTYSGLVLMGAVGIPIGIIVGVICALFGRVLLAIGAFRDEHVALLLPFLALAGLAIVFAYRTWGKGTDRGMSLVFDVGHGREDAISPRLVPLVMLSTWGTHLFGGSADLAPSNKTELKGKGFFGAENRTGANIHFGIREFAMAAVCNGIQLYGGFHAFCATFHIPAPFPTMRITSPTAAVAGRVAVTRAALFRMYPTFTAQACVVPVTSDHERTPPFGSV